MTKVTANLILVVMAVTWAFLSVQNGYFMPLSANFMQIAAALAGGSGVIAAAEKWGNK